MTIFNKKVEKIVGKGVTSIFSYFPAQRFLSYSKDIALFELQQNSYLQILSIRTRFNFVVL